MNYSNKRKSSLLIGKGIPDFQKITPKDINNDLPDFLKELEEEFSELENKVDKNLKANQTITWSGLMNPLHQINERLRWTWGVVCHLNAVCNTPEIREAHSLQQPEIVRFNNRIGQSKHIHSALCALNRQKKLDETQKRIIEAELRSMNHRGVALNGSVQQVFNSESERLAELSTSFSNNILDATKDWSLLLTKKSQINGLPTRALQILAESAKEYGDLGQEGSDIPTTEKGPWRLGLDMPRYIPFMTHGKNRDLRELLYKAHISRASSGKQDNKQLIEEILHLRTKQAKRLGYKNWAELSISNKMANDINEIEELLEELRLAAMPAAKKELEKLQSCARENGVTEEPVIEPWDINFWSEKLRKEQFNLDQESLRPWFPLPQVLQGLFKLSEKLFNITIENADGEAPIWHKDVQFFKVRDVDGTTIAYFFLDAFCRPANKRGGAWMDECLGRGKTKDDEIVLPVAYLICNQTPPTKDKPSLMSFDEVETLFHEFGHGLQHMLTRVDYPQAAGINNVEWDAVELPSQFMENWCLDHETLIGIAKHWKTGESLPEKEFQKLKSSRTFNAGLATLRQIHFALTDLRLHSEWNAQLGLTPDEMRRQIAESTTLIPPIEEDHFLCAFSHIFAGGYAAGYYSYKWAEVLSSDAYAAFEEIRSSNITEVQCIGKRFRDTILSLGGSKSPQEIFKEFRGRAATTNALIRHSGFTTNSE